MSDDHRRPGRRDGVGQSQRIPSPADRTVWSGRAGVPRRSLDHPEPATEWDEEVGRRWWLPIVVGLVALLVLGVSGLSLIL